MKNIEEIIDVIRKEKGYASRDTKSIAALFGISTQNLNTYRHNQRLPWPHLARFCEKEGYSIDSLLFDAELIGRKHVLKEVQVTNPEMVLENYEDDHSPCLFRYEMRSSSMRPTFLPGDILFFEHFEEIHIMPNIYLLKYDDEELGVYRLLRSVMEPDRIQLIKDNERYPVSSEYTEKIRPLILGSLYKFERKVTNL